jgi:hypothetical protein
MPLTAAEKPLEGPADVFLGEPRFEMQQLFGGERLPNIVVATDGTVLAMWGWGQVRVRRSEDGGKSWGPEIRLGNGRTFQRANLLQLAPALGAERRKRTSALDCY